MPIAGSSSAASDRGKPKQYRCEICGKNFDSSDTLNSHTRLDHSESGKSQSPAGVGKYIIRSETEKLINLI
jgi:uncharacterized Zn-finger protein